MVKVIIFHTPVRYGGGERLLILLAKEFKKNNLNFEIINLAKSKDFERELQNEKVKFITISEKELGDSPTKSEYLKHLFRLFPKFFNKDLKKRWEEAKTILVNDFPANFFVYFLTILYSRKDKKLIYLRHSYKNPEKGIVKFIYEKVLNKFDILVGVSSLTGLSLINTFFKLKNKVIVIPNGIDISIFENIQDSKQELRKKLKLPLADILAIYVARFSPLKNHLFLIEVLKRVTGFKIILIGDGETRNEFLNLSKKEGLEERIIYLGYLENYKIPYYLKASDFCLFPSLKEGFGIAILEAMAAGIPVVIFRDIYIEEFGQDILVAENEEEFIQHAKNLTKDGNLRKILGEKLKKQAEELDIKNIAKKYLEIL